MSRQAGVSKLDPTLLDWTFLCNHFARTTQKTQPLYCSEGVFTAPLHSNGSYSIVACLFVAAIMSLQNRCLAMDAYSDLTISVFGRRVTLLFIYLYIISIYSYVCYVTVYVTSFSDRSSSHVLTQVTDVYAKTYHLEHNELQSQF
jgi:hypothetical protein